ncbi:psbP domain-containing protein 5 [Populus alba x Populus x berolinensis]|nr:psbP domain-containing protein 5 [Populus alba x Populus x berolinensis]
MAMALLCSPSHFTTHHHNPFFGNQSRILLSQKKCKLKEKIMACSCACSSSDPSLQNGFCRRDLVLFGLSSSLSIAFPSSGILAEEDLKMASVVDEINAYTYSYPAELPSKKFLFKWVESRKPERYSSAAPLSPDARLRIVSERVDIIDNLILSVSIGPPNLQFVKSKDKSTWAAKDVADSVLSDKSSLRVTSTQRLSESSILDAHANEVNFETFLYFVEFHIGNATYRNIYSCISIYVLSCIVARVMWHFFFQIDGEPYWFYEYIVRKSPTKNAQESNLFRRYIASTAERDGREPFFFKANSCMKIYSNTSFFSQLNNTKCHLMTIHREKLCPRHFFFLFEILSIFRGSTFVPNLQFNSIAGYLYSLSASTLSKQWDKMGPYLEKTVASFRLVPPTGDYVPPYKDPWRFW